MPSGAPILAVDDEPALLRLLEQYLGRLGYSVETCSSPCHALEIFKKNPLRYRMVLVDLSMPEMSGEELLEQLLHLNPGVRILVCSGTPFDPHRLPASVRRQVGFLQKPFLPNMLAKEIDELLQQR